MDVSVLHFNCKMSAILFVLVCMLLLDATTAFQCTIDIEDVGCFNDRIDERALSTQLLNEHDSCSPVYGGRLVVRGDPNYLPGFICRCARKAKAFGSTYFGIKSNGECWGDKESQWYYDVYGNSTKCETNNDKCSVKSGQKHTNYVYKISDDKCKLDYTPLGCYHDNMKAPRPVPNYSMNERDKSNPNWNNHVIEWNNWNAYLPQLICRCAQVARKLGHDVFAIQHYGECWTGKHSNYSRDGVSTDCVGMDYKPCAKCFNHHCAGKEKTNFVYRLSSKLAAADTRLHRPLTNDDLRRFHYRHLRKDYRRPNRPIARRLYDDHHRHRNDNPTAVRFDKIGQKFQTFYYDHPRAVRMDGKRRDFRIGKRHYYPTIKFRDMKPRRHRYYYIERV